MIDKLHLFPEKLLVSLFKPNGERAFSYFVYRDRIKLSFTYLLIAILFLSVAVQFFTIHYEPILGDLGRIPYNYDPLTPVFLTSIFAVFSMSFRAFMNKQIFDLFIEHRSPFKTHEKTFTARKGLPKFNDAKKYHDAMLAKQNTMAFRRSEYAILSLNALYLFVSCFNGHLEALDVVLISAFTLCAAWLTSATEFRHNIPSNRHILQAELSGGKWVIEDKEGRRVVTNLP
jgi:hypothetical protein